MWHIALILGLSVAPAFAQKFQATIVHITDGDTVKVDVPAWANTPFAIMDVRIAGIDTPESRKPPAKCKLEVTRGLAAKAYARTLAQPGDAVTLTYQGRDKYFRIDGAVTLPDGRDFAAVMMLSGKARPYSGSGPKSNWCKP